MNSLSKYIKTFKIAFNGFFYIRKTYEQRKKTQLNKLRKIIDSAYHNTAFYRDRFDSIGLKPEDIRSLDDVKKIPLLTRGELQDNFPGSLVDKRYKPGKNCFLVASSGSTGEPVKLCKNFDAVISHISLAGSFLKRSSGIRDLRIMTMFLFGESSIETVFTDFLQSMRKKSFMKFDIHDRTENFIKSINSFEPVILFTYPSVLKDIAIYLNHNKKTVFSPKYIFTSGEILEKGLINRMKRVFPHSLILDTYFTTEAGMIAAQCPAGGNRHVFLNNVYLEILKNGNPAAPGETGDVVITDLNNFAVPLIRYEGLKDFAKVSTLTCGCGIKGDVIETLAGRIIDSIITPSGRTVNPFRLTELVADIEGVEKYQIIQKQRNSIHVKIVSSTDINEDIIRNNIVSKFNRLFDEDIHYQIDFTDDIKRDSRSGTFRLVSSEVKHGDN